ncbi:MAG: polysaccharide biosynthesis C-terminal domain-containing protein [Halobacteria archaeon]
MLKDLMRGGAQIWAGTLVMAVAGVAYNLIVARSLGPGGFGLYTQALLLVPIMGVMGLLSLDTLLTRVIPELQTHEKDVAPILRGAFFVAVVVGAAVALAYFLGAGFLAWRIFKDPALAPLLQLTAPAIFFAILYNLSLGAFRGLKRFRLYAVAQFLPPLLSLALVVPALRAWGVAGVLMAWILPLGLVSGLAVVALRKEMKLAEIEKTGLMVRLSLWLTVVGGILGVLHVLDRGALAFFESSETVGFYSAALLFLLPVSNVATSIRHSMFPYVSGSWAAGNTQEAQRHFEGAIKYTLVIQALLLIPVMGLGSELLRYLLPAYVSALPVLQALTYWVFPLSLYILTHTALIAVGETRRLLVPAVVSVAAAGGLQFLLIPRWHGPGAALAAAIGFLLTAILWSGMLRGYFRFPLKSSLLITGPVLVLLPVLQAGTGIAASGWMRLAITAATWVAYLGWLFQRGIVGKEEVSFMRQEASSIGAWLRGCVKRLWNR